MLAGVVAGVLSDKDVPLTFRRRAASRHDASGAMPASAAEVPLFRLFNVDVRAGRACRTKAALGLLRDVSTELTDHGNPRCRRWTSIHAAKGNRAVADYMRHL